MAAYSRTYFEGLKFSKIHKNFQIIFFNVVRKLFNIFKERNDLLKTLIEFQPFSLIFVIFCFGNFWYFFIKRRCIKRLFARTFELFVFPHKCLQKITFTDNLWQENQRKIRFKCKNSDYLQERECQKFLLALYSLARASAVSKSSVRVYNSL